MQDAASQGAASESVVVSPPPEPATNKTSAKHSTKGSANGDSEIVSQKPHSSKDVHNVNMAAVTKKSSMQDVSGNIQIA